jgi:CRP-like cAMP-binding protein
MLGPLSACRHSTFHYVFQNDLTCYVVQMTDDASGPDGNRLLAMLAQRDVRTLEQHLVPQEFPRQQLLHEANEPTGHVYFVIRGVVSLVKTFDGGETIEIAKVGPAGMSGTTLAFGSDSADHRAIVQVPGVALYMRASAFKRAQVTFQ